MEELKAESCIKMSLFVAWTYADAANDPDAIPLYHLRYDRICSLKPAILNLLQRHATKPFLDSKFTTVWKDPLMKQLCLDDAHVMTHEKKVCNLSKCETEEEKSLCQFDPSLPQFMAYGAIDSQVCEQTWSKWYQPLASILRHTSANRAFWFVYVFQQVRNEWIEENMKNDCLLIRSGISESGGFLRENWNLHK